MELDTYYFIHFLHGIGVAWAFLMGIWSIQ